MAYSDLLRNPFWQAKRLEILQRDNFRCIKCTDPFSNLQIHHLYYKPNLLPWEYPNECFQTLCELCHEKAEFLKWLLTDGIDFLKYDFSQSEVDYIYTAIQTKLESNYHHQSARTYMDSIKKTIRL